MLKSMTAFSNREITVDSTVLIWEIRSVNHRFLDASIYLPEGFHSEENSLKDQLKQKLGRGKVDAKLICKLEENQAKGKIQINEQVIKDLLDAKHKIESLSKKVIGLSAMDILNWPGVMEENQNDLSVYVDAAKKLFTETVDGLIQSRQEEGARLKVLILKRVNSISEIVVAVKQRRIEVNAAVREKAMKKLSELDVTVDNNRLEQELVYLFQRLDVDEELDRLDSHVEELKAVLERDEPIGRRLDFLMQELNREANTLASKANDAETTKSAVELKVLIEQMREQVMNIE
ncbi:YicC/YloC family endoribonuclease [uncultured Cocleimonas sp.]|uniref:YicC/YloC family endoribonuclease n=1 Tax=uncultured Cocleimonas sp. TaxID=1051587 RepID=UPI00260EB3AD|nr:YicC/YloC family endoribonuclease [uncultured Cocleimonas sp.]